MGFDERKIKPGEDRRLLGRVDYRASVHWQRGLVLEDEYGARALLEHAGNDVRTTVRSPYPERFLSALTYEVIGRGRSTNGNATSRFRRMAWSCGSYTLG